MISRRSLFGIFGAPALAGRRRVEGAFRWSHRTLGRTGRWVSPLGLGGQASLQWTGAGIDSADIIVRAVELGVNYLDSANAYGPSQQNYGEAFRRLNLDGELREQLYVATKTGQRFAAEAVNELKRSLTQMFGDGKGWIPEDAYLDCMQIHNLSSMQQVDQIYQTSGRIGALAGLLDYRDGSNNTGLNPERRQYLRHIGITGHQSSAVLMEALRRDEANNIDTLLVALNANDRSFCSHQNNVLPLARAKGLGVIAMKIFADGAMYGRQPRFSSTPADVNLSVGKPGGVPPEDLVRYPLSQPGVAVAITGIGRIDRDNPERDQLAVNLAAALEDAASARELRRIEEDVAARHGIETNYFQERRALTQPGNVRVERDGERVVVRWNTALAGANPIRAYQIRAGDNVLLSLPYRPQIGAAPLSASLPASDVTAEPVRVVAVE